MTDHLTLNLEDSIRKDRDLELFPSRSLDSILKLEAYAGFRLPVENYLTHLHYLANTEGTGVTEQTVNVVAHSIVSYLAHMHTVGKAELAQFMLPPEIDPYTEIDPEHKYKLLLIASWEDQNREKSKQIIADRFNEIYNYDREANLHSDQPEPASTSLYTGSMFSEKTLKVLTQLNWLGDAGWDGRIVSLIADAMEEDVITTRVRQRKNIPLSIRYTLEAERVNLDTALNKLYDHSLVPGDLVIIDEASFITWTEDDCDELDIAINNANMRGIFVEIAALNNDFRDFPLPFTAHKSRQLINRLNIVDCNAYYAYRGLEGETLTGNGKTSTFRIDMNAGFGDLLLPVVISRIHAELVKYLAVPTEAHFFTILKENDPKVFEALLAVGEIEELKQYYIDQLEQSATNQEA